MRLTLSWHVIGWLRAFEGNCWKHTYILTRHLHYFTWYWPSYKVKIKVTPLHAYTGKVGRRRYSCNSFWTSALEWGGWQHHAPASLPPGKDPVPIVQEAGWASGTVWTGTESFSPSGIQTPDREARSESLYRLSYPGQFRAHILDMKKPHSVTIYSLNDEPFLRNPIKFHLIVTWNTSYTEQIRGIPPATFQWRAITHFVVISSVALLTEWTGTVASL